MNNEQVAAIVQAIIFQTWVSQPHREDIPMDKNDVIDSWFDFINKWKIRENK